MSKLVSPHGGGSLRPLLVPIEERGEALKRAARPKKVAISSREVPDLFVFGMGRIRPSMAGGQLLDASTIKSASSE